MGLVENLPVYHSLPTDGSDVTVRMTGSKFASDDYNKWPLNRYGRFTGTGNGITVRATHDDDVDLYVMKAGQMLFGGKLQ